MKNTMENKKITYIITNYDSEKPIATIKTSMDKIVLEEIVFRAKEIYYETNKEADNIALYDFIINYLLENYAFEIKKIEYDEIITL